MFSIAEFKEVNVSWDPYQYSPEISFTHDTVVPTTLSQFPQKKLPINAAFFKELDMCI